MSKLNLPFRLGEYGAGVYDAGDELMLRNSDLSKEAEIVKRVNNHDKLVEALRSMTALAASYEDTITGGEDPDEEILDARELLEAIDNE